MDYTKQKLDELIMDLQMLVSMFYDSMQCHNGGSHCETDNSVNIKVDIYHPN
jgi:hypothetical protein